MDRLRKALPWFAAVLGSLLVLKTTTSGHLLYTVTGSIPRGVYWITPSQRAKRGDLVIFPIPAEVRELVYERRYLPSTVKVLAKPVAAVAGDHVCLRGEGLVVNGQAITLTLSHDAQGRLLPRHDLCRVLADGEMFVATTHSNSFDSRNFGPISCTRLRGTLTPILAF
jgi:conjugative transfer signal peptidase TraF